MTVQEIINEVLAYQFNSTRYGGRIISWIDQGQKDVARRARISTLGRTVAYTTISGSNTYSLFTPDGSTNMTQLTNIKNVDDDELLVQLETNDFDILPESNGKPSHYTIFEDDVVFYPTPDAEYNLLAKIYKRPTTISDVNSTLELNEEYHPLIVDFCLFRAYASEHDTKHADYHKNLYEEALMHLKAEEHTKIRGNVPEQVSGMMKYG
jgi:hypothetical protein